MKEKILEKCYELLEDETPLKGDCGKLCGSLCCKGDENTGMILFPGEENLIDENLKVIESDGVKYCICGGNCERSKRPLACRIFPAFPYMVKEGEKVKVRVARDARASICPLPYDSMEKSFIRKVRRAGRFLSCDEELRDFTVSLSEEITEIEELKRKLY